MDGIRGNFLQLCAPCPVFEQVNSLDDYYLLTSGFWPRVRARALRVPVFFLIATPNRALRAPPPIAASLLIIRPPKISKIYRTLAAHIKDFFLSTGTQRL
jgi:hypothetical protein